MKPMRGFGEQGIINSGNDFSRKAGYEQRFLFSKLSILIVVWRH